MRSRNRAAADERIGIGLGGDEMSGFVHRGRQVELRVVAIDPALEEIPVADRSGRWRTRRARTPADAPGSTACNHHQLRRAPVAHPSGVPVNGRDQQHIAKFDA